MKKLITRSCEEIMTTVYKPIEFVIDGLIAQGLYILAGAPKVGKSWLALDMCLSIAKGEKILGLKTSQGTALYLCLEDSYARIQNRLYEPSAPKSKDNIFLATLYVYLKRHISFTGTASDLVNKLKETTQEQFYPNRVTRDLVQNGYTLRKYGIDFQYKRTRNGRLIILHYDRERDSSDSKNTSEVTVNKLIQKV
ncbi:AAA family ATPase [Ruminococcus bicirculans (ex Wegman et al. 2014)]|uniref:AAA family ATPase n=1 Tax=Ruminococcus bicirculans (ex Wegman et al. 2014) TaxID=1160721 RepID=UPI00307B9927